MKNVKPAPPARDAHRLAVMVVLLLPSCVGEASGVPRLAPIAAPTPAAPTSMASGGYQPSVQMGNTTAMGAARVPFALYLNQIHNRIHPIFADEFLGSLNQAPGPWPEDLRTDLELIIEQKTGKLIKVGVVRTSGLVAFDLAALQAVQRAQPFGPAPEIIASPDGHVYIHWEFHRDPFDACATRNARPYVLKNAP